MQMLAGAYTFSFVSPQWIVQVENLTLHRFVRVTTDEVIRFVDDYGERRSRRKCVGVVVISNSDDAHAIAGAVQRQECPPSVFADWIEERPELWEEPHQNVALICERLRQPLRLKQRDQTCSESD